MKHFERERFVHVIDRASGATFADIELRRCSFESCGLSITRNVANRSRVKNVRLVGCDVRGCIVQGALVEDVTVEGLTTHGLFQVWAASLRHVELKGKIGRLMISNAVASGRATPSEQRAFDAANAEIYASTDWALDISAAEFEECEIRGIPAALIRRDPETQVVVTRASLLRGTWRAVDLSKTYWATSIEVMLNQGHTEAVFVAPKRHKSFRDYLDGLKRLRDAGIAEPD